jgi:hypothetical protein
MEPILTAMALHSLIDTPIPPLAPVQGRADRMRAMRNSEPTN